MSRHLSPSVVRGAVAYVSAATGVPVDDIMSERRCRPEARARQQVMWWLAKQGYSYPQIGRALRRDHTTVIFAERQVDKRIVADGGLIIHRFVLPVHRPTCEKQGIVRSMETPRTLRRSRPRPRNFQAIARYVTDAALNHGLPMDELLSGTKTRAVVTARKAAWRALIADGFSVNGIAAAWGCDRTGPQRLKRSMLAEGMAAE